MDYQTNSNSGVIKTKWVDNDRMQLKDNSVGTQSSGEIEHWSKQDEAHKNIKCSQTVIAYNKSVGSVDLADILIYIHQSFYQNTLMVHKSFLELD